MFAANCAYRAGILYRNRLSSAGVVGNREHNQRYPVAAHLLNELFQCGHIHVALEGMETRRLLHLNDRQIECFRAHKFNVGAGGIEMSIVRHHVAFLAHSAKQNALGGTSLMRRNHMLVAEDVLY